jgi:hypothetical protein
MTTVDLSWKLRAQKAEAEITRLRSELDDVKATKLACACQLFLFRFRNVAKQKLNVVRFAIGRLARPGDRQTQA